jgi:hypothetical protein
MWFLDRQVTRGNERDRLRNKEKFTDLPRTKIGRTAY